MVAVRKGLVVVIPTSQLDEHCSWLDAIGDLESIFFKEFDFLPC